MIMSVTVNIFMMWPTKQSRRRLYVKVKLKNEENKEGTRQTQDKKPNTGILDFKN
jgi:hypothetical protein